MGNKRSITDEELKLYNDGDKPKRIPINKKNYGESKRQKQEDENDESKPEEEGSDTESSNEDEAVEEEEVPKKHIRPCICDLTQKQKDKIQKYLKKREFYRKKYEKRVAEIEIELARIEEERLAREREAKEQEDLFADEYEMVGSKKKRKKRSARRASMVSLGVKQIINWKKPPRITVKNSHATELRKKYTSYCGRSECPISPPLPINFRKEPNIPIRATHTLDVRTSTNVAKKEYLIKHEDKRPRFVTDHFVT